VSSWVRSNHIYVCLHTSQTAVLKLPRMKTLSLSQFALMPDDGSDAIHSNLQHMEQLQSLTLCRCRVSNLLLPPSIKHLDMATCTFIPGEDTSSGFTAPSFPPLPNLKTLKMSNEGSGPIYQESFPLFICQAASKTNPGVLSSFRVHQSLAWRPNLVDLIRSPWFRGLTSLRIDTTSLEDSHNQVLIESCPDLQTFHINGPSITGVFLSQMIKAPTSKLRKIVIDKCHKVSTDIVPWAEERGVEIVYIAPRVVYPGRRVHEQQ